MASSTQDQAEVGVENKRETRMDDSDFAVGASSSLQRCLPSLAGQPRGGIASW